MNLGFRPAALLTGLSVSGFLVAALAAQGCTVTVSNEPYDGGDIFGDDAFPNDDVDSGTDAGNTVTDPCGECLYTSCSAIHAACNNSLDCSAIYNCAVQPGADVSACIAANPNGNSIYTALYTCDQRNACTTCTNECATSPIQTNCSAYTTPVTDDAGTPDATTPVVTCDSCTTASCSAEKAACGAGSDCQNYSNCVSTCVTGAPDKLDQCVDACGSVYTAGKTQGEALSTCTNNNCASACFPPTTGQ